MNVRRGELKFIDPHHHFYSILISNLLISLFLVIIVFNYILLKRQNDKIFILAKLQNI